MLEEQGHEAATMLSHSPLDTSMTNLLSQSRVNTPIPMTNMQCTGTAFVNIMEATKTYKVRVNNHTVNGDSVMKGPNCTFGNYDTSVQQVERKGLKGKILRIKNVLGKRKGEGEKRIWRHSPKIVEDESPFVTLAALKALEESRQVDDSMEMEVLYFQDNSALFEGTTRAVTPAVNRTSPTRDRGVVSAINDEDEIPAETTRISPTRDRVRVPGMNEEDGAMRHQLPAPPLEAVIEFSKHKQGGPRQGFKFSSIIKTKLKKSRSHSEPQYYHTHMKGLVEQVVPKPDFYRQIPDENFHNIKNWVAKLGTHKPDDEHQDDVLALSTAELLGIEGAMIDRVELVKKYLAPPASPSPELVEAQEKKDAGLVEIIEENTKTPQHKDLIRYMGVPRTSNLPPGTLVVIPSQTTECPLNTSDYYGIPLVEPKKSIQISSNNSISMSPVSSFILFKDTPTRISPGASLVLYLHGKGLSTPHLLSILSEINTDWLFSSSQIRWTGDFRVPDLSEFNDQTVTKIRELCKCSKKSWEHEDAKDKQGVMIPPSKETIFRNQKRTEIERFVKEVVEEYLEEKLAGGWVEVASVSGEEDDLVPFLGEYAPDEL